MKTLKFLKLTIDVLFYIVLFSVVYRYFLHPVLITLTSGESFMGFFDQFSSISLYSVFHLLFGLSKVILFLLAIFYLRMAVRPLSNAHYFTQAVTSNLKKSGILLVSLALINLVVAILSRNLIGNLLSLNFWTADNDYLLILIIGLFFIFLEKVLSKGRSLEEENELTI